MLRSWIRDIAADMLALLTLTSPSRRAAGRLGIATFHRVLPETERRRYPLPGLCVTPDEFDWFLKFFRHNFECGPLTSSYRRWQASLTNGPADGRHDKKPLLAITFDDGQLDNYEHALPILERNGLRASFYVPVQSIEDRSLLWHDRAGFAMVKLLERPGLFGKLPRLLGAEVTLDRDPQTATHQLIRYAKDAGPELRSRWLEILTRELGGSEPAPAWAGLMSWDQLRELNQLGHEIGSHTMGHQLLTQCSDEQLRFELTESKAILEQHLARPVDSFCYPNGDHDDRVVAAVERAGYENAITTTWGLNTDRSQVYRLRRWDMNATHVKRRNGALSAARLALRMSGLQPGLGS